MKANFIFKHSIKYEIGETISLGNYQSMKPVYAEEITIDVDKIPEGVTIEQIEADFIESVRQKYTNLKNQVLNDFLAYSKHIQNVNIPAKR